METTESGTQTEHVSIADNGAFTLSPEALDAMDNVSPPAEEEAEGAFIPDAQQPEPQTRTIKHNGQTVEVPADQEVALIQKGYNYEQKMAQLEAERAKLQSYNGLVAAIEASPEIRQKVSQALGYGQEPQQQQTPQFDDPIEQLKWEVRQETLKEVESKFMLPIQQQQQQQKRLEHAANLEKTRLHVQSDPHYKQVQAAILEQLQALPDAISSEYYKRLDSDPQAYIDMYTKMRARITKNQPTTAQATPQTPATPEKRATKAPILESGNNAPSASEQTRQSEHIKALERRSKNGDFRATGELMALLA